MSNFNISGIRVESEKVGFGSFVDAIGMDHAAVVDEGWWWMALYFEECTESKGDDGGVEGFGNEDGGY